MGRRFPLAREPSSNEPFPAKEGIHFPTLDALRGPVLSSPAKPPGHFLTTYTPSFFLSAAHEIEILSGVELRDGRAVRHPIEIGTTAAHDGHAIERGYSELTETSCGQWRNAAGPVSVRPSAEPASDKSMGRMISLWGMGEASSAWVRRRSG